MKHFVPAFCLLFTAVTFVPAETPGQGAPQADQTQGQPQPLPGHPPGWVPGGPVPPSPAGDHRPEGWRHRRPGDRDRCAQPNDPG